MPSDAWSYILARIALEDRGYATPCWIWQLKTTEKGYARSRLPGIGLARVHRVAYELRFGPIDDGLVTDHLCRVTSCVNPHHLELVTPAENTARGNRDNPRRRALSHCLRGHARTPENLTAGGNCRTCLRERAERRRGGPHMKKQFCVRGHPRTPENLTKNRTCRICLNAWRRAKRREAQLA